jgi:hypothetical protein
MSVNETLWERSADPGMLLQCIRKVATARKLRLFACACWRIVAGPLNPLVLVAEQIADDPAADLQAVGQHLKKRDRTLLGDPWETARDAMAWKPDVVRRAVQHRLRGRNVDGKMCWEAWTAAQRDRASLVREIFRCPFRPLEVPSNWPLNVVELANALYQGQDCGFALHDALTEAGQPELAEHFAASTRDASPGGGAEVRTGKRSSHPFWHPKGCWAVDLILGKQ